MQYPHQTHSEVSLRAVPLVAQDAFHVLVVEDDFDDFYLTEHSLRGSKIHSYVLTRAKSLEQAFSLMAKESFDAVLLDLGLKDSDGLETLRQFLDAYVTVPVIVVTGVDDEQLGEDAVKLGAYNYIPKKNLGQESLTRHVNFAIEHSKQISKIKSLALVDVLTQLPNRRALEQHLQQRISYASRSNSTECFAVAMIDLDGFKQVNDQYGHAVGDEVLKAVAQCLMEECRASDFVARLGGDEFVYVLEHIAESQQVIKLLERQRKKIEALAIGNNWSISASVGFFLAPSGIHDTTPEQMLKWADEALYQAKKEGKNCTVMHKKQCVKH